MAGRGRKILFYLFIIFLLAGAGYLLGGNQEVAKVGAIAPNFQLENLAGEQVELKKIYRQNQLTLVNFRATWCPSCRAEIPALSRFYREYRTKGVEIMAVNIWDASNREQLRAYAASTGINFPVLMDRKDHAARKYRIIAVPTTVFIDRQGRIREIYLGALTYQQLQTRFERYLAPES
ncbi:MAG TPA: TlpA disulfide reductase family protein [Capillibacterium sp.]